MLSKCWAVQAKLIIVYASTGRTASLVAKYRPPMPILTLVVPNLKSTALSWQMQGRSLARQLLCMRGRMLPYQVLFMCIDLGADSMFPGVY